MKQLGPIEIWFIRIGAATAIGLFVGKLFELWLYIRLYGL